MDTKNLFPNQMIKNYRKLCEILGIEISGGNSKIAQLKELRRYVSYSRRGQSYIINEIYESPKDKQDKRFKRQVK